MKSAPTVRRRCTALWLCAAFLPLVASAASIFVHVDPGQWLSMPAGMRRSLAADAMLYIAGAVIVAAPLAGIALASAQLAQPDRRTASTRAAVIWPLCLAVGLVVTSSAIVNAFAWGALDSDGWTMLAIAHATLAAVTLALAAFGALCGALFRDPLDAAACSLIVVLIATGGLLVAGVSVADAPRPLVEIALAASPLIAIASAAHVDVIRMGVPYQISPLAHIQIDYPGWAAVCASYLAVSAACFLALTWKHPEVTLRWPPNSRFKYQS
jgi:hypothetical protein